MGGCEDPLVSLLGFPEVNLFLVYSDEVVNPGQKKRRAHGRSENIHGSRREKASDLVVRKRCGGKGEQRYFSGVRICPEASAQVLSTGSEGDVENQDVALRAGLHRMLKGGHEIDLHAAGSEVLGKGLGLAGVGVKERNP